MLHMQLIVSSRRNQNNENCNLYENEALSGYSNDGGDSCCTIDEIGDTAYFKFNTFHSKPI